MTGLRTMLRELDVFAGELPDFDPAVAPDDPAELFTRWLLGAVEAGVPEPHAMTVSTADAAGRPSARVLILKNVEPGPDGGWQFAAHGASGKGHDLAERPYAALTFYWQPLARQIRVRGPVEPAGAAHSAADFLARGEGARAEALLGRQSTPLSDLATRDAALAGARARLAREPDLVPPEWTLYTVRAQEAEFWQGDRDRNHTRLRYRRAVDGGWARELLWP
ncbi:pyridoxal 5'-phosphate synthase [Streptomyces sp. MP131-18]|uniref:pyridoxine/pyridoxamine 5'-phosphate oxidase n=1 Tax=Streptomyces sp. MP131-18 TaxID=1857892 RepID=UPI00097C9EB3|nr:pyridoxal 5'-phosphate synthase [Streptomyces sp. MP131-18]ONK10865.1 Pyridoxine/pyridoxamine 5'-phosphate oxidase [Streptomyces sp. MP131-18]